MSNAETMDVATLADRLRDAAAQHHHYEQVAPEHDWADWYAAYIAARAEGGNPEEASKAAGVYMEGLGIR